MKYTRSEIEAMQDDMTKAAKENGHSMTAWRVSQYKDNWICYCHCRACFDNITIDTRRHDPVVGVALGRKCDPDNPNEIPF